ncbi:MAG: hypothetical protein ACJA1A_002508 [Saprospiraceae bacterium]|jgi:hypothetical protein
MKTIYTLAIGIFFTCIIFAQEVFNPENYAFDCYSEVELPRVTTTTLYVYDGLDPNIETEEVTIMLKSGQTKWEKRKADRNCLSANPEDCLVWCLVEVSTPMIYDIVKDTSSTTEWYPYKYTISKKGEKVNDKVLCNYEIRQELLNELRDKLYKLGYDIKPKKKYKKLKGKFNREFKQFQEDYELPVGKWTVATMMFLFETKLK